MILDFKSSHADNFIFAYSYRDYSMIILHINTIIYTNIIFKCYIIESSFEDHEVKHIIRDSNSCCFVLLVTTTTKINSELGIPDQGVLLNQTRPSLSHDIIDDRVIHWGNLLNTQGYHQYKSKWIQPVIRVRITHPLTSRWPLVCLIHSLFLSQFTASFQSSVVYCLKYLLVQLSCFRWLKGIS